MVRWVFRMCINWSGLKRTLQRLTWQCLKCDLIGPLPHLCPIVPYGCDTDDVLGVYVKSRQVYFSDASWNLVPCSGRLPAFGWGDLDNVVGPVGTVPGHDWQYGLSFLNVLHLQLNCTPGKEREITNSHEHSFHVPLATKTDPTVCWKTFLGRAQFMKEPIEGR